jgi:hypothetical protein
LADAEVAAATISATQIVLPASSLPEAVMLAPPWIDADRFAANVLPCARMTVISAGKFFCNVADSASKLALTVPDATSVTLGGLQLAFACALALQFAEQFASTLQLALSVPPLHETGVDVPWQPAEHVTFAPAAAVQFPAHLPLQLPLHETPGGVALHVPLHMPMQLPPASVATLQLPSHFPWH